MEQNRVIYLYKKYRDDQASASERDEFISALSDPKVEEELKAVWSEEWDQLIQADIDSVVVGRYEEIHDHILAHAQNRPVKVRRLWPAVAAAVCLVMAIGAGIWFYRVNKISAFKTVFAKNDIAPGKNRATLIMPDGKTINLSDTKTGVVIDANKLAYNDGTRINAINPANSLIATTPRGGTYLVILQDGTKVWLNAASSIKFPSSFAGLANRKIELLSGEAYFEVVKNRRKPFVVVSGQQQVVVLGTHFNINAYPEEHEIRTTLLEGSVKISIHHLSKSNIHDESQQIKHETILEPGQQSIVKGNTIDLTNVDAEELVAWKNGKFVFDSQDMLGLMRQVSRWYNVEVIYHDNFQDVKVSGSVSRFANISTLLDKLEKTGSVHFKLSGRTVTLTKKAD